LSRGETSYNSRPSSESEQGFSSSSGMASRGEGTFPFVLPSSAKPQHGITFPSSPGLPILYLDPPLSFSSSAVPILVVLSVADHSIPVVVVFCSSFFNPCLKYEFPSLDQPHWGTLYASQITSNPLARTLLSGL